MPVTTINPYANFPGTAEQAIELYKSALGAVVEDLMRWEQMPGHDCAPEDKKRIMHASLRVGGGMFMVSDVPSHVQAGMGADVQLCLTFDEPSEMQRKFEALAQEGQVIMALHDAFWGDKFGMLKDKFGLQWMFVCPQKKG